MPPVGRRGGLWKMGVPPVAWRAGAAGRAGEGGRAGPGGRGEEGRAGRAGKAGWVGGWVGWVRTVGWGTKLDTHVRRWTRQGWPARWLVVDRAVPDPQEGARETPRKLFEQNRRRSE